MKPRLEDVVQKHGGEGRVRGDSFYTFCIATKAKPTGRNLDVCSACGASAIVHSEREGSFTCSRCGVVQSEGQVVGTFSDVERVLKPSAVVGDLAHVNFSYGKALKDAVASHELTAHLSVAATEQYAHLCLVMINELWQVVVSKTVKGSIPFLITQGAQFAQENRQMPDTARCVDIILRKMMQGVVVPHMYTKFLLEQIQKHAGAMNAV
jgi:hypothetical protein